MKILNIICYNNTMNNLLDHKSKISDLLQNIHADCKLISQRCGHYDNNNVRFIKYKLKVIEKLTKDILYRTK